MSNIVKMIDPPNGHAFGFPKTFDGADEENHDAWLVANGYPQEWVELFPGGVPSRILYTEDGAANDRFEELYRA